jgi:hypothetical protein
MQKSVSKEQIRKFTGRLYDAAGLVEVVAQGAGTAPLDPASINRALSSAATAIRDVAEDLGDLVPGYEANGSPESAEVSAPAAPIDKHVAALERISAMLYTARTLAFESHANAVEGEVRASVVDALGELIDQVKERVDAVVEGVLDERRQGRCATLS